MRVFVTLTTAGMSLLWNVPALAQGTRPTLAEPSLTTPNRAPQALRPNLADPPVALPPANRTAAVEAKLNALRQETQRRLVVMEELRTRYGDAHPEVRVLRADLEESQRKQQSLETELVGLRTRTRPPHYEALARPLDIELSAAAVEQAAEAISQACGLPITVHKSVSRETRITLSATAVPLAVVLESIATQAGLKIAPTAEGLTLTTWPAIKTGGETRIYTGALFPWADEWNSRPTRLLATHTTRRAAVPGGGRPPVAAGPRPPTRGPSTGIGGVPSSLPGGMAAAPGPGSTGDAMVGGMSGGYPGRPDGSARAGSGVGIAALGDKTLVVAEPELTDDGRQVVRLTVYKLVGGQLQRLSQTIHSGNPIPRGGMTGMPGMGMPGMAMPGAPMGMSPATAPRPRTQPKPRRR